VIALTGEIGLTGKIALADVRTSCIRVLALAVVSPVMALVLAALPWSWLNNAALAAESRQETIKRISDRALSPGAFSPRPPELLEMIKEIDKLIQAKADDPEALHLRGALRFRVHDMEGSIADLTVAIKLNPKYGRAYWDRGLDYIFTNRTETAISDFNSALANGEKSGNLYLDRGAALQNLGKTEEAIEDFNKAIELNDGKSPKWPVFLMRAGAYTKTKKFDLAIKDDEAVIATNRVPTRALSEAHRSEANALFGLAKYQDAADQYTKAADGADDQSRANIIFLRGACYSQLGEKDKARADLEEAKSLGFGDKGSPPQDKPFKAAVVELDQKIKPYVEQARKTFPGVKERFLKGLPPGHLLSITTRIFDQERHMEQVFVLVKSWSGDTISGVLASDVTLKGHQKGETLQVLEKDVIDWTISNPDGSEEGNVVGKFLDTVQQ
jgi:tetratricopeptide (TPR) repeat protein